MDFRMDRYRHLFLDLFVNKKQTIHHPEVQRLADSLQDLVGKEGFICDLVGSRQFLREVLVREYPEASLVQVLQGVETGLCCLMKYAVNLMREPYRKEYHLIKQVEVRRIFDQDLNFSVENERQGLSIKTKKYTGYYVCNITEHLGQFADNVLLSLGYQYIDPEFKDELVLNHLSEFRMEIAFQLFLSVIDTRKFIFIASTIKENQFSDKVAAMLFDKIDNGNFQIHEVLDYCRHFENDLKRKQIIARQPYEPRSDRDNIGYEPPKSSGPKSLLLDQKHADINEDEIFGDADSETFDSASDSGTFRRTDYPSKSFDYDRHHAKDLRSPRVTMPPSYIDPYLGAYFDKQPYGGHTSTTYSSYISPSTQVHGNTSHFEEPRRREYDAFEMKDFSPYQDPLQNRVLVSGTPFVAKSYDTPYNSNLPSTYLHRSQIPGQAVRSEGSSIDHQHRTPQQIPNLYQQ